MPRRPTGAAAKGRPGTMSKKAKAKANGVVKQRGPAKVIPLPKTGKGKAKALDADQGSAAGASDEETDEELLDAEDMVGAGMSSSDEEEGGEEEDSGAEKGTRKSKANASGASSSSSTAKARGLQPDTGFLRSLDVNAISTSRAEEKRLKKEENKRQLAELRAAAKLVGKGKKPSLVKVESRSKEEGESGSEDYDFDSEDDNLTLSDLDEDQDLSGSELDFDSDGDLEEEDSEEEDSEDEEELEDRIAKQVADKAKRKRIEEQQKDSASAKKQKLPVRGENGWLQDEDSDEGEDAQAEASGSRVTKSAVALDDDEDDSEEEQAPAVQERKSNVETGARFGMMAPYSIMEIASRPTRLAAAREQIARLAQNILSDPEAGGIGFLRRIAIFAKVNMPKPSHMVEGDVEGKAKRAAEADDEEGKEAIPIDAGIRAAAILSLMAVYSDILPGYRIRPLTDAELTEKVSQDVQRRRDFEQGIVNAYREYLELCEKIVKGRKELSPIALKALTTMLLRAPHFNYRTNIIRTLVARLSRSSWDEECANCASALIRILREDLNGEVSLEIVRLLHRMIKERHYKAHPFVLDILLHLRLKEELGDKRASTTSATTGSNGHIGANRKAKPSQIRKGEAQHLSKRDVKKAREMKEIEKEMREADATVDLAERERNVSRSKGVWIRHFEFSGSQSHFARLTANGDTQAALCALLFDPQIGDGFVCAARFGAGRLGRLCAPHQRRLLPRPACSAPRTRQARSRCVPTAEQPRQRRRSRRGCTCVAAGSSRCSAVPRDRFRAALRPGRGADDRPLGPRIASLRLHPAGRHDDGSRGSAAEAATRTRSAEQQRYPPSQHRRPPLPRTGAAPAAPAREQRCIRTSCGICQAPAELLPALARRQHDPVAAHDQGHARARRQARRALRLGRSREGRAVRRAGCGRVGERGRRAPAGVRRERVGARRAAQEQQRRRQTGGREPPRRCRGFTQELRWPSSGRRVCVA